VELDIPIFSTLDSLIDEFMSKYPDFTSTPEAIVVAVNEEYRSHSYRISEGDEIAFIPPVSGGSGEVLLTNQVIDQEAITAKVRDSSNGAVVTFLGTTRGNTGERQVNYLEYEAYDSMAEKKLAEIILEIRNDWNIEDIAIAHRLGRLDIGDISLVVAIASPHRKDAFEAIQYCVDRIKEIVPIWKKEYFQGGEVWIESPEFFESQSRKIVD
tara:strand:- start:214 stop:849 length:636 start_codon:yes stop_codon:yes gene_type:complete